MAEAKKEKDSFIKEVISFYLAPDIRSVGTLLYLGIFGYFALYYVDSVILAVRFLFYVLLGHTALSGSGYLFAGLVFVICLVLPFFISLYAIFVLQRVWTKPSWANKAKAIATLVICLGSILAIMLSEGGARYAARQDAMQSFIQDSGLSGKV
ncbi:MAG TPA: hypothetical protein VFQ72_02565 [Candidatus Paceibacterota bacterium]|nr:hypothetical protein [Candidatus Paceibacterota bacterium]